jgi:hypothetical protein
MIAAELLHRGPIQSDLVLQSLTANSATAAAISAAMKLRDLSLSPADCLLAMKGLWISLGPEFPPSPLLSPVTTPSSAASLSFPFLAATTSTSSFASYPAAISVPSLATTTARAATGVDAAITSFSTNSTALLDHDSWMVRSRALPMACPESGLEHRANVVAALRARRTSTSSSFVVKARKLKTKFSLLGQCSATSTTMLSRGMRKKSHLPSPAGLQPLRAPPPLPRVTPGQQLIGMKWSSLQEEVTNKD